MDSQHRLTDEEIKRLVLENARLNKTVQVLMDRVEHEMDQQQDSFTIFQTAIKLEETVNLRTNELSDLNNLLMKELSEREIIEAKLQIAKRQAEEANRSKTKFLATASHDLRQPLNAARLFVGSLAGAEMSAENAQYVTRIANSLDALDDLLSVLLNISQLDSGGIIPRFCHFRLQDLLDRIVPDYIRTGEESGLRVRMVATSKIIYSDPRLLETILRNFLSNAIRYTKIGGVLIGCTTRDNRALIRVIDTGIGIKENQLGDIFEEFTQVHEDRSIGGRGIGLGLSIVQRISNLLNADIEVKSVLCRGSLFGIILPLGERNKLSQPYSDRSNDIILPNSLANRIIVVIDNDEDVLDGMEALLGKWGCDVILGVSADVCLAQLIAQDKIPDVIIADYHLGGGDTGVGAISEIRAEYTDPIPAILITSDRDPALAKRLKKEKIPMIYKPVAAAGLHALIKHLLQTTSVTM